MSSPSGPAGDPPPPWLRAVLDLAVPAVLLEGDRHGYALAQRLSEYGLGTVRGGVLYPVLGRLEAEGLVRSTWQPGEGGPGRKVYSMTDLGRHRLAEQRNRWQQFSSALDHLLAATAGELTTGTTGN